MSIPTRLTLSALIVVLVFAVSGCGAGGGDSTARAEQPSEQPSGSRTPEAFVPTAGSWAIHSVTLDGQETQVPTGVPKQPELRFGEGSLDIVTGCNNLRGPLTVTDAGWRSKEGMIGTKMFCEGWSGTVETVALRLFGTAGDVAVSTTDQGVVAERDGASMVLRPND